MLLSFDWLKFCICVFQINYKVKVWVNVVDKVMIVLSFVIDWVREWCDFFCLIIEI